MKRVYRSRTDKMIFGICGGIGEAYGIDPNLIRIVVVFLDLATAVLPVIVTYIVARLLLPPAKG
ncbi:MAG: PspC domain-containing protein [Planctomycetes bacterium]|nr:PspC domain-containing protein [Planctomycetota bacterium]